MPATAPGHESYLLVEGLHCGACVERAETALCSVAGVQEAHVHLTTGRATIVWLPDVPGRPRVLMAALQASGLSGRTYDPAVAERPARERYRDWLIRLAVSGFGALATMFLAEPLYYTYTALGAHDQVLWQVLRYLGMVVGTATGLYAAQPFLRGAIAGLAQRRLTMDALVALGVVATLGASLWGFFVRGPIYFDCLTMFLFFLTVGRFAEAAARGRVYAALEHGLANVAATARVQRDTTFIEVAADTLVPGELVEVRPGERLPADGDVEHGEGTVDESLLTGESRPVAKAPGARVVGGAINLDGVLRVRVTQTGPDTTFARLARLVETSAPADTRVQRLADTVAHAGTLAVLGVALATGILWSFLDPGRAIPTAVAVLIVTCPCALGLATPVAYALAMGRALASGVLIKRGEALEDLLSIRHIVIDKTGTLTQGEPEVCHGSGAKREVTRLAATLEAGSEHPLARAVLRHAAREGIVPDALPGDFRAVPGQGVEGTLDGTRVRVGRGEWLVANGLVLPADLERQDAAWQREGLTTLWVARGQEVLGALALGDRLREDASTVIGRLRASGLGLTLLTGDNPGAAAQVAKGLGIVNVVAGVSPEGKVATIQTLRALYGPIAMIGDGLNDAPALAAADVGIAMARGADLATLAADVVILGGRIAALPDLFTLAHRTMGVIRGNFMLSALYNVIAIPLAIAGIVTPLLAAIMMPLSSLIVLANAMRLRR